MKVNIYQAAYELGYTAGQMAGYAKAMRDIREAREGKYDTEK